MPDIVEILGPRPYPLKESILEYIEELKDRERKDAELKAQEDEEAEKVAESVKFEEEKDENSENVDENESKNNKDKE